MTDKTHLDALLDETNGDFGKALIAEFTKLTRDPDVATASYSARLRALMDDRLQATDDAPG